MKEKRKHESWNPLTGCEEISPGCRNCYARRMAESFAAKGSEYFKEGFKLTLRPKRLELPLKWRKPRLVFVTSMSDLFQDGVEDSFIRQVFAVMRRSPEHIFMLLTKRSRRLAQLAPSLAWPVNIWAGVTAEDAQHLYRLDDLRKVPASLRFVFSEPMLGLLEGIDLQGISWVLAGGETGPGARPMRREWAVALKNACAAAEVPFYFRGYGGTRPGGSGRSIEGREYREYPQTPTLRPSLI